MAKRSVSGSGVTAPYGTIDDTGRLELSSKTMESTGAAAVMKSVKTSRTSDRKIREMLKKKVNSFTGVPETDMRVCFNRLT